MKTLQFKRNNDNMPILGLGTWKSDPGKVKKAVVKAIETGYRHIDCAAIYGNENEVGEGIAECIDKGLVKRDELWITSKLWNDSHQPKDVKPAIESTLKDLQLDYLDLYLVHWPIAFKNGVQMPKKPEDFYSLDEVPLQETWRAMEDIQEEGLTRHIGVSNFSASKIKGLLENARQKPEMNQIEIHPYLQQHDLVQYCKQEGIHLTAYSPLGSMDRPDALKKDNEPVPLQSNVIKETAEKHNCEPAQVLIAFAIARNLAVIPKSTSVEHIQSNFEAHKIELDEEDLDRIQMLEKGYRFVDGAMFVMEGNSYSEESIWT